MNKFIKKLAKTLDKLKIMCYYLYRLYHTKNNLGYYDKVVHRKALTPCLLGRALSFCSLVKLHNIFRCIQQIGVKMLDKCQNV